MLYVKNLTQDCSEEKLKECFEQYGKIERVKKIKDYAFVHFEDRDNAVKVILMFLLMLSLAYKIRIKNNYMTF